MHLHLPVTLNGTHTTVGVTDEYSGAGTNELLVAVASEWNDWSNACCATARKAVLMKQPMF